MWRCVAVLALIGGIAAVRAVQQGYAFWMLDPEYAQYVFASTNSFQRTLPAKGYLGGVAVLQNGDVIAAECETATTRLHWFDATATYVERETPLHTERIISTIGGCGIAYHPDGFVYSNMNDGTHGVSRIDLATGAATRMGPPGNALGIAVDPITHSLVYAAQACKPAFGAPLGTPCRLYDLDPASGAVTTRAVLDSRQFGYIDGIAFDPTGQYIFLTNRFPFWDLVVLTRTGELVQQVAMVSEPVGLGFHAASPKFVVTNNQDGTLTRFDFPGDDFSAPPVMSDFAVGGFRGDLMQAGPDSCLYVTQNGTRYNDGDEAPDRANSIVRICGGFAPPPGIELNVADVGVRVSVPASVTAGSEAAYALDVVNAGPSAAGDVVVTHTLPPYMRFASLSAPSGWSCTTPAPAAAGTLSCRMTSLAAGAMARLTVRATVDCVYPSPGSVAVSAQVASTTFDPAAANDTDSATTGIAYPEVVVSGSSVSLPEGWPPNHRMFDVTVNYTVSGGCGGAPTAALSVSANEATATSNDWLVHDARSVSLRAERQGNGDGRIYTIMITARDAAGSTARQPVQVIVPHDQGRR